MPEELQWGLLWIVHFVCERPVTQSTDQDRASLRDLMEAFQDGGEHQVI
jgi:hypothetical protein